MTQSKLRKPNGGNGRPKGARNKITKAFKEAVLCVFDRLGGEDHLELWARKNPSDFYRIMARLIPLDQATNDAENVPSERIIIVRTIKPPSNEGE